MRCVIANGFRYIRLQNFAKSVLDRNYSIVTARNMANSFCKRDAQKYIDKFLDKTVWIPRYITGSRDRYIITDMSSFVQDLSGTITSDWHRAYVFDSAKQAAQFIDKHELFSNPRILDVNLNLIVPKEKSATQCKRITFSNNVKNKVYHAYNGHCGICGTPVDPANFTIDHILPLSRGGKNTLSNYQLACPRCNTLKSNYTNAEFARSMTKILANQFEKQDQNDLSDMIIQSIVRGKINEMRKEYR